MRGTRYKSNTILTLDILNDNNPQFATVKDIFLCGYDKVIFECSLLITIGFDEHVYCYEVSEDSNSPVCFIYQSSLLSYVPNNLNIVPNRKKYITVRNPL